MKKPLRIRRVFPRWCRPSVVAIALLSAACTVQAPTAPASSLSPLHQLDEASSAEFRRAFDDAKDRTRFIVALSPTWPVCVRGASALGDLLTKYPDADVRVLVVWEPVILTDLGPPMRGVRRPLSDPRVVEFWDEKRWLSPRMVERAAMIAREKGEDPPLGPDEVAWDVIAIFPPGTLWENPFPAPSWYGEEPVERSLGPVEETLKNESPAKSPGPPSRTP